MQDIRPWQGVSGGLGPVMIDSSVQPTSLTRETDRVIEPRRIQSEATATTRLGQIWRRQSSASEVSSWQCLDGRRSPARNTSWQGAFSSGDRIFHYWYWGSSR